MWRWRWTALLPHAIFYAASLPRTVQNLDSGELVAAGVRLWVPHPPGYPLYVWLLHGFLNLTEGVPPFLAASSLTALYVLGGLALLIALADTWLGVACVALLGALPVVSRYAVLPDVFGLHLLATAALLYCVFADGLRHRALWLCLVFGLGAANHQTIVFLAPAVLFVIANTGSWRSGVVLSLVGAAVTIGLYMSLLAFDTAAPQSWGNLRGVGDVVRHFLRSDFGSLSLSARADGTPAGVTYAELLRICWPVIAVAVVSIVSSVLMRRGSLLVDHHARAWLVVCGCLVAYVVVFLSAINFPDGVRGIPVRERFFIFPCVLLTALAVRARIPRLRRPLELAIASIVTALAALGFVQGRALLELRDDTVIEDWARNMLDTAASGERPHFLILDGDTETFAVQYVQAVSGERDVITIDVNRAFDFRFFEKVRALRPALHVDEQAVASSSDHGLIKLLVEPNIDAFDFTTALRFVTPRLQTVYYPCGRRFLRGTGITFAGQPGPMRLSMPERPLAQWDPDVLTMWNSYSDYFLARARVATANGVDDAAMDELRRALTIVPWCTPCRRMLCELASKQNSDEPGCR